MKKKLLILTSIFTLFSCGEANTSINNDKNYILTGNIDLGEKKEITLNENNGYTYTNLILRRGDSFTISSLSFDNLNNSNGFYKGNNNYINVLNEGIYDLKIDNNTIFLTKKDSSYQNVELIYLDSTKEKMPLKKNDDFSYSIENVPLRNREGFYIALDDEKLTFSDLEYNETYYNAFKFDDNNIITKAKGNFNFKIDFLQTQPLIITSENLTLPNIAADDLASYELLKNNLVERIHNFSNNITLNESIKEETEDKYSYIQTIDTNQNYFEKTNLQSEKKEIQVQLYNDKNYFDITSYENSSNKSNVAGKIIGQKDETSKTDSSLITVDKEYILLNEAYNKVHSIFGIESSINNVLNSLIEPKHLNGLTTDEKENYKNSLKVQTTYINDYGDIIKVNAENIEKNSSQYIVNNLELIIDDNGNLNSAKYKLFEYSQDDIMVSDDITLKENAQAISTSTYDYNFKYEERKNLTIFSIDLDKIIANDITCIPEIDLSIGDTIPNDKITPLGYSPSTSLDISNFKIISYDSSYFYKNYNGSLSGNKIGSTTIRIGNTYNDVYFDIVVNINYKAPTSLTIKDERSDYNPSYFINETYTFVVTPSNSGGDPAIEVSLGANQNEYATIDNVSTDEEARKQGKATFTITTKKETNKLDLIVKSKSSNNITATLSIKVQSPLDINNVIGNYYYYGDLNAYIKLYKNNTGVLKGTYGDKEEHSFIYKIENSKLMLVSSDTLSRLEANVEASSDSNNGFSLYKIYAYTKDNTSTNLFSNYSRYTAIDDSKANMFYSTYNDNQVTLTFDLTTLRYDTYNKYFTCEGILYVDDETYLKFKLCSNYTISGSIYIKDLESEEESYNYTSKFAITISSYIENEQIVISVNNKTLNTNTTYTLNKQ